MLKFLQKFHFNFCLLEALLRTLPLGVGTTLYALRDTPCHLSVPIWSDMIWLDKPKAFHFHRLPQISILFFEIKVTLCNPFSLSLSLKIHTLACTKYVSLSFTNSHTFTHTRSLPHSHTWMWAHTRFFSFPLQVFFPAAPKGCIFEMKPKGRMLQKSHINSKRFFLSSKLSFPLELVESWSRRLCCSSFGLGVLRAHHRSQSFKVWYTIVVSGPLYY